MSQLATSQSIVPADVSLQAHEPANPSDLLVPRLILLQAASPQLESISGASPGQLLHSITLKIYQEVRLCSVEYWREFVLFRKRELGGGFIDTFATRDHAQSAVARNEERMEDYEIVDTAKHLCLLLEPDEAPQPVVLYCARSQHRFSRTWNTQIQLAGPEVERWSTVWRLSPVRQQNAKGSWYSLAASLEGWTEEAVRDQAAELARRT